VRGGAARRSVPRARATAPPRPWSTGNASRSSSPPTTRSADRDDARRIPEFVDRILVVDDASTRRDGGHGARLADPRVELVRASGTAGVGAAIVTGYEQALAEGSTSSA
jgi:hypothetical protein